MSNGTEDVLSFSLGVFTGTCICVILFLSIVGVHYAVKFW